MLCINPEGVPDPSMKFQSFHLGSATLWGVISLGWVVFLGSLISSCWLFFPLFLSSSMRLFAWCSPACRWGFCSCSFWTSSWRMSSRLFVANVFASIAASMFPSFAFWGLGGLYADSLCLCCGGQSPFPRRCHHFCCCALCT